MRSTSHTTGIVCTTLFMISLTEKDTSIVMASALLSLPSPVENITIADALHGLHALSSLTLSPQPLTTMMGSQPVSAHIVANCWLMS